MMKILKKLKLKIKIIDKLIPHKINFIKDKEFHKNAFAYDAVEDTNINSRVAYGIFDNEQAAKLESNNLAKNNYRKNLVGNSKLYFSFK